MIFLICTLGYYIWAVAGWGEYMHMKYFNWELWVDERYTTFYKPKIEIYWIDKILSFAFIRIPSIDDNNIDAYCLLGMSLRGLHIAPLFIALAWYYSNPLIVCLSWGLMLQGIIYYVFNSLLLPTCVKYNIDCNACAEYATGGLIGLLIVIMRSMIC